LVPQSDGVASGPSDTTSPEGSRSPENAGVRVLKVPHNKVSYPNPNP
jgi:hypothetical protein